VNSLAPLWQQRRSLAAIGFSTAVLAALGSLLVPNRYTARVRITSNTDDVDLSQLSGGLAALASRLPASLRPTTRVTPEFVKGIALMDRTLSIMLDSHPPWTDSTLLSHLVIDKKDSLTLKDVGLKKLSDRLEVTADISTGIVTVTLWDRDRRWAAAEGQLAALAIDSVMQLSRSASAASLERFLGSQLAAAHDTLKAREDVLLQFNLRNRALQSPSLLLETARIQRGIDAAQDLYQTLQQQAVAARLRQVQNTPTVTILDPPREPYRKSWPPRAAITLLAAGLAVAARAAWLLRARLL
jgi:uncharacterized protein involved in exopolysaccharide biosynthesis